MLNKNKDLALAKKAFAVLFDEKRSCGGKSIKKNLVK